MTYDLGAMPLSTLLRHTPLAIAAADATGRLTMFTPALQRLMNQPFKDLHAEQWASELNLFADDGLTPIRTEDLPLAQALRGQVVTEAVVSSRLDARCTVFLRCDASPLLDEGGQIVGALAMVQDVTAERIAQRDQEVLRERLVATVNHELRTPLTKIIGHAEILQDDPRTLPDHLRWSVSAIARAAEDLMSLTRVISDLTDLECETRATKTRCDLVRLVQHVTEGFRLLAAARELSISVIAPRQLLTTIDPRQIERALAALLDNAVTYAPDRSSIEVVVRRDAQFDQVHVRDSGIGIPSTDVPRLLQPFERGDHPLQPVNSKGLGLTVAHTVAAAHGGELLLTPRAPAGLCATLKLPHEEVL